METAEYLINRSKNFAHFFTSGSPQDGLSKSEDHLTPKILHIFGKMFKKSKKTFLGIINEPDFFRKIGLSQSLPIIDMQLCAKNYKNP